MKLHWLFDRFMAPADDGAGGAAGSDRGDDFTPTDDDAVVKPPVDKAKPAAAATEVDPEADPDPADEVDPEADPDPKAKTKPRIPLDRHKAVLAREREQRAAVEAELARYKQGEKVAEVNAEITQAENALVKLEEQHAELLADGKAVEAAKLMSRIRQEERAIIEQRAEMQLVAVQARAVEQVRYETTVERLEEAYPQINPDHEDFDKEKTAEVLDLKAAFQSRGETPSKALQKAVKYVFPAETTKQKTATEVEARVDKDAAAKAVADARQKGAVKKNIDAALKQAPNTSKVGMDHDKAGGGEITAKTVMNMDYEQFRKLSDADLAKARGDDF